MFLILKSKLLILANSDLQKVWRTRPKSYFWVTKITKGSYVTLTSVIEEKVYMKGRAEHQSMINDDRIWSEYESNQGSYLCT